MNVDLHKELALSMFRLRKISLVASSVAGLNIGELFAMDLIAENASGSYEFENDIATEIQHTLLISKPAISQMFNALEKKGYLNREINKNNRRKLILNVTPKGKEALDTMREHVTQVSAQIISRFGEDNMRQFLSLLNDLVDISEEVKKMPQDSDRLFTC